MSYTVYSCERHIFPARRYFNMFFITFQSLNDSNSLAFSKREDGCVPGPQAVISAHWCLPNDTLETRKKNRAAINLKSMCNHLKCLNPDLKWRAQTHFFRECAVLSWSKQHIPMQTAFCVKSIGCFTYMKRLCFPFDNENFGQETEKIRVGCTSIRAAHSWSIHMLPRWPPLQTPAELISNQEFN